MQVAVFLVLASFVMVDAKPTTQGGKRTAATLESVATNRKSLSLDAESHEDTRRYSSMLSIDQQQHEAPELVDLRSHMLQDDERKLPKQRANSNGYSFGYQTDNSSHYESSDMRGVVRGQYTVRNSDGTGRVVDYVADQDGFRAVVSTDEFGTTSRSSPGLLVKSLSGGVSLASKTSIGEQRYLDD